MRQTYRRYIAGLFCSGPLAVFYTAFGVAVALLLAAIDCPVWRDFLASDDGRRLVQEITRSPLWSPLVIAVIFGLCFLLYKPVKWLLEREVPSMRQDGVGWCLLTMLLLASVLYLLHVSPSVLRYAFYLTAMQLVWITFDLIGIFLHRESGKTDAETM